MLSRTPIRSFFAQHNIPVVPQGAIKPPFKQPENGCKILVGYLLCRQPLVQHTLHPLEQELGFVLDREYNRYPRHPNSESADQFFKERGMSIDSWNRSDPSQIQKDFYGLESHRDATKQTVQRFEPVSRLKKGDFFDPCDPALAEGPPVRHTVQRRLDDFLYLIVKNKETGKWTVPAAERQASHSLRTAVEVNMLNDHKKQIDAYLFSNAPQGVLQWGEDEKDQLPQGSARDKAKHKQLFVFCASYMSGRPSFESVIENQASADHAWVTRHEMADYEFDHEDMYSLLRDISNDTKLRSE